MRLATLSLLAASIAHAGPTTIAEVGLFVHAGGTLQAQLNDASSGFTSTLNSDNLGSFGWSFTNTTGLTLSNLVFLVFLDADIDRASNTYFNEFGEFESLSLPPGAPGGAITATAWEIDEPGFVFGDIYNNLLAGILDNSNGVPSGSPDDVSLALGFELGHLAPGQTATLLGFLSLSDIGGLSHTDPATPYTLYFNAYATTDSVPSTVPEPGTALAFVGVLVCFVAARTRRSK